jgi:hypothetical protein
MHSEPVLLRQRAKRLSKITGNKYLSRRDAAKPLHTKELFVQSMKTPWILLFTEPIALLMALYMAVIYAILYVSDHYSAGKRLTGRCNSLPSRSCSNNTEVGLLPSLDSLSLVFRLDPYLVWYYSESIMPVTPKSSGLLVDTLRLKSV